jgi:hypothetical protein
VPPLNAARTCSDLHVLSACESRTAPYRLPNFDGPDRGSSGGTTTRRSLQRGPGTRFRTRPPCRNSLPRGGPAYAHSTTSARVERQAVRPPEAHPHACPVPDHPACPALRPGSRWIAAAAPLGCYDRIEGANPVMLSTADALGILVAIRCFDNAPLVASDQAAPVLGHRLFLPARGSSRRWPSSTATMNVQRRPHLPLSRSLMPMCGRHRDPGRTGQREGHYPPGGRICRAGSSVRTVSRGKPFSTAQSTACERRSTPIL